MRDVMLAVVVAVVLEVPVLQQQLLWVFFQLKHSHPNIFEHIF